MEVPPPSTYRKYVHSHETLAIAKIVRYLQRKEIDARFDGFFGGTPDNCNILCLGSGAYNDISNDFFQDDVEPDGSKSKIMKFGEYEYVSREGRHELIRHSVSKEILFKCEDPAASTDISQKLAWTVPYRSSGPCDPPCIHRVKTDFGVIVRKRLANDFVGLLLCGFHSHGTRAAAEVAMSREFQKMVKRSRFLEYAQIVRCQVYEDGLRLRPPHWDYPLICLEEAPQLRWAVRFLLGVWRS